MSLGDTALVDASAARAERESELDESAARAVSLTHLFTNVQSELQSYFVRRLGNVDLAAEFAQETFLRFSGTSYSAEGEDARAIIFGIARNLVRDHSRRQRRQAEWGFQEACPFEPELVDEFSVGDASPEHALTAQQDLERVVAAIQALPPRCRQVFTLHRLHGRSHKEIARELGITRSMVEKHIMEAVTRLMKVVD
jgi:RNA polymerase sigma factor (sigma-70 family)